jgi:hypothetical protein
VFPCLPNDKRPAIDRWEQRASCDPEHVAEAWGGRYADHNIGVACGPSRLTVLDLDTHGTLPLGWRDEPGVHDGKDVLATLAERAGQPWPTTMMVATPSDGWHLYYRAPARVEVRNSASKIGPLVDVRGVGGYVVGAGSVTDAGHYEMLSDPDEPVEPLPPWLLALIFPPPPVPVHREPLRPHVASMSARLRGVVQAVLDSDPGTRNGRLHWAACRAAEMITEQVIDRDTAEALLLDAALESGLRGGEREARLTIASGLRNGGVK